MNDAKYIGMDVHQATISVAVRDSRGNLVMEAILETKAETILQFIRGLRGSLYVTFEEGTWAAWLHDLLQPHVARVLASDPRKNALLKAGNKNDRIDARKLSELLYLNKLSSVYHGEPGIRTLKELARSYIAMTRDLTRVMSRLKAIYRSWGIPCAGQQVYAPRYRAEWLAKIRHRCSPPPGWVGERFGRIDLSAPHSNTRRCNSRLPPDAFLEICARRGQRKPASLLLKYLEGDYNCLHQDVLGDVAFPFQITCSLSRRDVDYSGGNSFWSNNRAARSRVVKS